MNSFHDSVNEKNATTARAGTVKGITIRNSTPRRPQPSTMALSSSSIGMDMK